MKNSEEQFLWGVRSFSKNWLLESQTIILSKAQHLWTLETPKKLDKEQSLSTEKSWQVWCMTLFWNQMCLVRMLFRDAWSSKVSGVQILELIQIIQKVWGTLDKRSLILLTKEMGLPIQLQTKFTLQMVHQRVWEWLSQVLLEVQMMASLFLFHSIRYTLHKLH